ncbi:MAG: replicative DNA helicase, partial [Lentisphaeria bacterium]|nr:replicative DNA helicase [Lentisphaeria bacterium]
GALTPLSKSVPDFADIKTEQAVLAAILSDPASLNTVVSILGGVSDNEAGKKKKPVQGDGQPSFFQRVARMLFRDPKHAMIYEAILELQAKQSSVDTLSLSEHLQRAGKLEMIGGLNALLELQDTVGSTANVESWCEILRDYALLREMLRACRNAEEMCRNPVTDVKNLLDEVEQSLYQVRNTFQRSEIKDIRTLMTETFEFFMRLCNREIEPGIPTGFPDLDNLTGGGLKKQEMFVLAARPSIGKTALALNIVRNIVMKEVPGQPRKRVMFFSLEMSAEQVAQRMLCTESEVSLSSIMDGTFNSQNEISKLTAAVSALSKAQLVIDPTGGISIYELRAKARKEKDLHGLDLIVIDYLQLMKATEAAKDGRQAEVAAISGGLKKLAKDLDVPVLVLAQLNRETEKGQGKNAKPKLSNLRESGAIEQDADVVVFLHRDRDEAKEKQNPEENRGPIKVELIVEKNRNGKTGIAELEFVPSLMVFRPLLHSYSKAFVPGQDAKTEKAKS